jgi:anti-sigma regulatory factor (Ser/Thr protein kinase)/predicted transcriptional regulator
LELLRQKRISGVPVIESGQLIGILSLEDLIRSMCANDTAAPVRKYMTSNVLTVNSFHPIIEALEVFAKSQIGRLPVLDESGELVGMVTKGDLTRGILRALQKDYHEEEVRRYRASHLFEDIISDRTSLILRYQIKPRDFLRLGANPQIARRCGIAIYEAEINLIIHTTNGGIIRVEIDPQQIRMGAIDEGPGIADVNQAMRVGFSTASEEIRELGFGAGMGLNNIQRCVDTMTIESTLGQGTRLEMVINLNPEEGFGDVHHHERGENGK